MLKNSKTIFLAFLLSTAVTVGACRGNIKDDFSINVDSEMDFETILMLLDDAEKMKSLKFEINSSGGWQHYFEKTFGADTPEGNSVVSYIGERINYLVSQSVDLDTRLYRMSDVKSVKDAFVVVRDKFKDLFSQAGCVSYPNIFCNSFSEYAQTNHNSYDDDLASPAHENVEGEDNDNSSEEDGDDSDASGGGKKVIMAYNAGVVYWLHNEFNKMENPGPWKLALKIAGKMVELNSTRVGIVQLGEGFNANFPQIGRTQTMVHEARHSDCTGGLPVQNLVDLKNGKSLDLKNCGNSHVLCPVGHSFAGYPACDGGAWQAYSVGGLYSLGVTSICTNCSGKDKKVAAMLGMDAFSRVLVDLDEMFDGKLGDPDMSSLGIIN